MRVESCGVERVEAEAICNAGREVVVEVLPRPCLTPTGAS